jgi:exodeoxyribonuclease V alpha subunit
MVDILLMNHLLKAIRIGTRIVLVGDVDQLPSVGAGNVLKDIIASEAIKTIKLTDIYRQAEESMIVVNAHRINRGELPYLNLKGKEFFFMPRNSGEDIARTVVELVSKRLPATYGYDPMKHIQVLTPTKKGPAGVANLNVLLQDALNREHDSKSEKVFTRFTFREGDRVMQIRNNYNLRWIKADAPEIDGLGVFNGDMGIITDIDNEEQKLVVLFDDDKISEYDFNILDELEPAYAITIHKSQGSEFPAIIIPVFPGPQVLMTRNLVYTAVTRARSLVVIVGSENTLKSMVENDKETFRYSGLEEKLRRYLGLNAVI